MACTALIDVKRHTRREITMRIPVLRFVAALLLLWNAGSARAEDAAAPVRTAPVKTLVVGRPEPRKNAKAGAPAKRPAARKPSSR